MTAHVSIVTPAYNAAPHIEETVLSVIGQSYGDWELIIVDDCSRDETCSVVRRLAQADRRIRLIEQKKNGGPARARQAGLDAAAGRYVAFLDSDDYWLPRKLERQLGFMREKDAAFSFTSFRRISADGSRLGRGIPVPARLSYRELLGNTAIATSTAMIDRGRTGPFRMTETYYDDFALWLEITRRGFDAFGLNEDLMRYRVLGGSVSRNKWHSAKMVWRLYREVEGLGILRSWLSFASYVLNGFLKYRAF